MLKEKQNQWVGEYLKMEMFTMKIEQIEPIEVLMENII